MLIALGEKSSPDAHMLTLLKNYDVFKGMDWSEWDKVCGKLSAPEIAALAKSLTLVESLSRSSGGSVAASIRVFFNFGAEGMTRLTN